MSIPPWTPSSERVLWAELSPTQHCSFHCFKTWLVWGMEVTNLEWGHEDGSSTLYTWHLYEKRKFGSQQVLGGMMWRHKEERATLKPLRETQERQKERPRNKEALSGNTPLWTHPRSPTYLVRTYLPGRHILPDPALFHTCWFAPFFWPGIILSVEHFWISTNLRCLRLFSSS